MPVELPVPTREQVTRFMHSRGMVTFDRAPWDLNLVGLAHPDLSGDSFRDRLLVLTQDKSGDSVERDYRFTTIAGLHYFRGGSAKHPAHKDGTAILLRNQQVRGMWQLYDHPRFGYELGRQVKGAQFVRDADLDNVRDYDDLVADGNVHDHVIGAHLHRGSEDEVADLIGAWSATCQVVPHGGDYRAILWAMHQQVKHGHGDTFTYSLLRWEQVLQA